MKLQDLLPLLDDDALERLSVKHVGFGSERDARDLLPLRLR